MIKELTISQILVYYDLPEIFVAKDNVGTNFICLLVATGNRTTEYISTAISLGRLQGFSDGSVDLRDIFESPEIHQWWFFDNVDGTVYAHAWEGSSLPEHYLPERGFVYSRHAEGENLIANEVIEKQNVVVHLALSDSADKHSINADDLGDIVKLYQMVIENTYKKVWSQHSFKERKSFNVPNNYKLRAFSSSYSSFNLHLFSTSQTDLFGNALIEPALEKFDLLTREISSDDDYIAILRTVKGHTISSLKKLVKRIADNDIKLKHKWFAPNQAKVHTSYIDQNRAKRIQNILNLVGELAEEVRIFSGYFVQVDIDRGTWRIFNLADEKEYSGEAPNGTLQGVTVETVIYHVRCQEIMEELKVTEKERIKYILLSIEQVE